MDIRKQLSSAPRGVRSSAFIRVIQAAFHPWASLAVLFLILSYVYFRQDLTEAVPASVQAHGDGIYYYAHLRSLLYDRDLSFDNEYSYYGNPYGFDNNKITGRAENDEPIGPALFWAPFGLLAHFVETVMDDKAAYTPELSGYSNRFQRIVFFGSLFWGFVGLILIVIFLRRLVGDGLAVITIYGLVLCTPLAWYLVRQACYSHAISLATSSAFVLYWLHRVFQRTRLQWAILGLLAGLCMLVRLLDVGHLVLPLGEWIVLLSIHARERRLKQIGELFLSGFFFATAALVTFFPQILVWYTNYGAPVLVTVEGNFFLWDNSMWSEMLFSSRNGLFSWHPLLYCSVLGLFALGVFKIFQDPSREKSSGAKLIGKFEIVLLLLSLAVQVYVNGCWRDWWGSWSFGQRRLLSCSIHFAIGLAWFFYLVRQGLYRISKLLIAAVPIGLVGLAALFNFGMMDAYLRGETAYARNQAMGPLFSLSMDRIFDKVYRFVGNVGSFPLNWLFALRAGVTPDRFDLVGGSELLHKTSQESIEFSTSVLATGGFSEGECLYLQTPCRWVEGDEAVLILPFREARPITATTSLAAALPGTHIELSLRGVTVLKAQITTTWQTYTFALKPPTLSAGMNYLSIRQLVPPRPSWPIGQTGKSSVVEFSVESSNLEKNQYLKFIFDRNVLFYDFQAMIAYATDGSAGSLVRLGTLRKAHTAAQMDVMVKALGDVPLGFIVVLALNSPADYRHVGLAQALRGFGALFNFQDHDSGTYALIGVKGSVPGHALESFDNPGIARLCVGRPVEQRGRGVAWGTMLLVGK